MPNYEMPCIIFQQRETSNSPKFALFRAPAGEVLEWATVRRRSEDAAGAQRKLSKAKINSIAKFLRLDERNVIPPAIIMTLQIEDKNIVALQPDESGNSQSLHIINITVPDGAPDNEKPGLIIDGQHRIYGIQKFDSNATVPIVALLNADDMETAFQFLVINNKVTKVSRDLIRTLALDYEENELAERLKTARLSLSEQLRFVGIVDTDEDSPFRGHLTLESHEGDESQRFVPAAAIENAIAVIHEKKVSDLVEEDALCDFFYAIWRPIKEKWQGLWTDGSKLMQKVSIVSMTSFITDALISKYDWDKLDVTDADEVQAVVVQLLENLTPDFWSWEWTMKVSDAEAVRQAIKTALTTIFRNKRANQPWHEGVEFVKVP